MSKPDSLRRNIAVNYASQVYVALIGIAMVPLYLKYMGIEAYGLVGFFAMVQAWSQVLDFGLSQTLGREAAKFNAGVTAAGSLNMFLRLLEIVFGVVGVAIIALSWALGLWVAESWLKLDALDPADVARCVAIVGIVLGLRLVSGVYRGGLLGLERQVGANSIAAAVATLRSVAVVPVLIWVSNSILAFFLFQLAVAVVEVVLLRAALRRSLPGGPVREFRWEALKEPMRFGRGLAFLSSMWVAVSQGDKLILSHMLPLQEYWGFVLATTIALGTILVVSPLQQAVLPRLIVLAEKKEHGKLVHLYRKTTILLVALLAGFGGVMVAFPAQVLYAWTGDVAAASQAAEVLRWYAAGTSFMGAAAMSYLLQHAHGDLGLHIKGNLACLFILIPAVIFSTWYYGAVGAAMAWAVTNLLFLLLWTPVVHGKFLPEIRAAWLLRDVFPALAIAAALFLLSRQFAWPLASRVVSALALSSLALLAVAAALLVHFETRQLVLGLLRKIGKHA